MGYGMCKSYLAGSISPAGGGCQEKEKRTLSIAGIPSPGKNETSERGLRMRSRYRCGYNYRDKITPFPV